MTAPAERQAALLARLAGTPLALMLDVDGTLSPLAARPEEARVPPETRRVVASLAAREGVRVALVSGRAAADARRIVGVSNLWVIGNHGAEVIGPDGETAVDPRMAAYRPAIARAARRIAALVAPVPGVILEDKTWTLSVHYRLADEAIVPRLHRSLEAIAIELGLRLTEGKKVYELRPPVAVHKGTAVLALARQLGALEPGASLLFVGDDQTDEDAFRVLRAEDPAAVTLKVGDSAPAETAAEFTIADPPAVRELLERIDAMVA